MKISAQLISVLALLCVAAGGGTDWSNRPSPDGSAPREPSQSQPRANPASDPAATRSSTVGGNDRSDPGLTGRSGISEGDKKAEAATQTILWIGGTICAMLVVGFFYLAIKLSQVDRALGDLEYEWSTTKSKLKGPEGDSRSSRVSQDTVPSQILIVSRKLEKIERELEEIRSRVPRMQSGVYTPRFTARAEPTPSPTATSLQTRRLEEGRVIFGGRIGSQSSTDRPSNEQVEAVRLFETDKPAFMKRYDVKKLAAKSRPGDRPFMFDEDPHGRIWLFSAENGMQNWAVPSGNIQINQQTYRDFGIGELFNCGGYVDSAVYSYFHVVRLAVMVQRGDGWMCEVKGEMTVGSEAG